MKVKIFVILCSTLILANCAVAPAQAKPTDPIPEDAISESPSPVQASPAETSVMKTKEIPQTGIIPAETPTLALPVVVRETPISGTTPRGIYGAAFGALDASSGFDQMAEAGMAWVRLDLAWNVLEQTKGNLDWNAVASTDQQVVNAADKGMNIILIVGNTPSWALLPPYKCGPIKPSEMSTFASTMYQVVKRYSAPPFNVRYWEFWNEPDVEGFLGCWGSSSDTYYGGGNYGEMLKAIAPTIRAADPNATILIGGLLLDCDPGIANQSCPSSNFLEGILQAGAGNSFDGVSFHAYDYYNELTDSSGTQKSTWYYNSGWGSSMEKTGPTASAKASFIRRVLEKYSIPGKTLLNTETAVYCGDNKPEATCPFMGVGEYPDIKNIFIAESYATALAEGFEANIWYNVLGYRNSELLNQDLSQTLAYQTYKFSYQMLGTSTFKRNVTEFTDQGINGYEFSRDYVKKIWILWYPDLSTNGVPKQISLPSMPTAIYDLLGNPIPPSLIVDVGKKPIYIEW